MRGVHCLSLIWQDLDYRQCRRDIRADWAINTENPTLLETVWRKGMLESEKGFSMIELLVAVGILGILASIALVNYESYRKRAFDARAVSDLRNTISAQEVKFADDETYEADISLLPGFDVASPAVTLIIAANGTSWSGSSYHPRGTRTYCYSNSNAEGIVIVEGVNQACP